MSITNPTAATTQHIDIHTSNDSSESASDIDLNEAPSLTFSTSPTSPLPSTDATTHENQAHIHSESCDCKLATIDEEDETASQTSTTDSTTATSSSSKIRGFVCHVCLRKFNRVSALQAHVCKHTGEKPFRCDVTDCRSSFTTLSNLRRHYRRIHRMNIGKVSPHGQSSHQRESCQRQIRPLVTNHTVTSGDVGSSSSAVPIIREEGEYEALVRFASHCDDISDMEIGPEIENETDQELSQKLITGLTDAIRQDANYEQFSINNDDIYSILAPQSPFQYSPLYSMDETNTFSPFFSLDYNEFNFYNQQPNIVTEEGSFSEFTTNSQPAMFTDLDDPLFGTDVFDPSPFFLG